MKHGDWLALQTLAAGGLSMAFLSMAPRPRIDCVLHEMSWCSSLLKQIPDHAVQRNNGSLLEFVLTSLRIGLPVLNNHSPQY
jgi:hypothetical protein